MADIEDILAESDSDEEVVANRSEVDDLLNEYARAARDLDAFVCTCGVYLFVCVWCIPGIRVCLRI